MENTQAHYPKKFLAVVIGWLTALVLMVVVFSGCSAHAHKHTTKVTAVKSHRCRTLGQANTPNASVIIHKNCLRNGVTTVAIVVHNKHNAKLAARDAVLVIKDMLGFAPTLHTLAVGEDKKTPFILAVVGDSPVAAK